MDFETSSDLVTPVVAQQSKQAKVGRGKVRRDKAKVYKTIKSQEKKIKHLKKQAERWKKKFYIAKDSDQKNKELTPRTKLRKFLHGEQVSEKVKKKLLFGEVLSSQVCTSYKSSRSY